MYSEHDMKHIKGMRPQMQLLGRGGCILAYSGYIGAERLSKAVLVAQEKSQIVGTELQIRSAKKRNRAIAKRRIRVEEVFGRLVTKFRRMRGQWHGTINYYDEIASIAYALVSIDILRNPLSRDSFCVAEGVLNVDNVPFDD